MSEKAMTECVVCTKEIEVLDEFNGNYTGHKVIMTRATDKFVSLADRAAHANRE